MRERITTAADFPGLAIYREELPTGPVYSIEFWNKEQPGWGVPFLFVLAGALCIVGTFYDFDRFGASFVLFFPALVIGLLLYLPRSFWRVIEMDFGAGEMRIKRSGRVKIRKPLPRFDLNVTLERHPMIYDRNPDRARAGQKQHCLVGYFGLMGTDRTVLMCRHEWPPQQSLMEVQGAIMLVWKFGQQEQLQMLEGRQGQPQLPGGIAPPLE
jgi:hypothetical protein